MIKNIIFGGKVILLSKSGLTTLLSTLDLLDASDPELINPKKLDSLSIISILTSIEADFDIEIDFERLDISSDFYSVATLFDFLNGEHST